MSKYLFILLFCFPLLINAQTASNLWLFQLKNDKKVKFIKKITDNSQYDNQPVFIGNRIFFTSQDENNTEIKVYDLESGTISKFTNTPESEYSPSPTPDGQFVTTVRVESDGKQRLWNFPIHGGAPILLIPEIEPVGYYTWFNNDYLAMFILGEPNTLQISKSAFQNSTSSTEDKDIGRSIHSLPNHSDQFSYIKNGSPSTVMIYNQGQKSVFAQLPENTTDITWTPNNTLLTGVGSTLLFYSPAKKRWKEFINLQKMNVIDISRMDVSEDGKYLVVVVTTDASR